MNINQQLFDFIQKSPSPFHAIQTISQQLEQQGFQKLHEHESWKLQPDGKYYVTRNRSPLWLLHFPKNNFKGF